MSNTTHLLPLWVMIRYLAGRKPRKSYRKGYDLSLNGHRLHEKSVWGVRQILLQKLIPQLIPGEILTSLLHHAHKSLTDTFVFRCHREGLRASHNDSNFALQALHTLTLESHQRVNGSSGREKFEVLKAVISQAPSPEAQSWNERLRALEIFSGPLLRQFVTG